MRRITIMTHDGPCGADCDKPAVAVEFVDAESYNRVRLGAILATGLSLMLALTAFGWWKLGAGFALVTLVQIVGFCALWTWMIRHHRH